MVLHTVHSMEGADGGQLESLVFLNCSSVMSAEDGIRAFAGLPVKSPTFKRREH